jgi:16S rRNA (guanine(1405)-N(7))-methyltransferase
MTSYSLDDLIDAVRAGSDYRTLNPDLVRWVAQRELPKNRSLKEAVKAVRGKLHQVGGAYLPTVLRPVEFDFEIQKISSSWQSEDLHAFCRSSMALHASTRERLPLLETFFQTTLGGIAPLHSVLDLACGLNPLALPWMPLAEDLEYTSCDVYADLVQVVNRFFAHVNVNGKAFECNLVEQTTFPQAQVTLLLKTLPCLEQLDKQIGVRLLEAIPGPHILVSFPAHSLGGRGKGMPQNYERHFNDLIAGKNWRVQRFEFSSELAFLISR